MPHSRQWFGGFVAAMAIAPIIANGQGVASLTVPAPHPLGAVIATSSITFDHAVHIRSLSDGRVLVNDPRTLRIILLDAYLTHPIVGMDSAVAGHGPEGDVVGPLLPFYGDSSLSFDQAAIGFDVIDPAGQDVRTLAEWPKEPFEDRYEKSPFARSFALAGGFQSLFSPTLGIVTIAFTGYSTRRFVAITPDSNILYRVDDSMTVVSMNPRSRVIDTLGTVLECAIRVSQRAPYRDANTEVFQPSDQLAITSDGSLAILRAREYRIDWVNPDRSMTAGPPLPYPWLRLSDADKRRVVDSANTARTRGNADTLAAWIQDSTNVAHGQPRYTSTHWIFDRTRPWPEPMAELADVADAVPSVDGSRLSLLSDRDNNLWILPWAANPSPTTPHVYDVVNRQSQIIDRVRLPAGQTLVGFGPNGTVYLLREDGGRFTLLQARVR